MNAAWRSLELAASLAVAVLGCGTSGAPLPRPEPRGGTRDVTLGPGDAVRIDVWRNPELSGEFTVGPDGGLLHPLYRAVQVVGVPQAQVETRVREYLLRFQTDPQFVVQPLLRVAIGGEVARPNLYMLRPDVSIVQAVALAGGSTERGRRDRVLLVRGEVPYAVQFRDPLAARLLVRSGDQLIIERRGAVLRDILLPIIGVAGATAAIVTAVDRARETQP